MKNRINLIAVWLVWSGLIFAACTWGFADMLGIQRPERLGGLAIMFGYGGGLLLMLVARILKA